MASQSLISTVNGYENYIKDKGKDEQVINAYVDACSVAINGEKDIEYGLQLTKRAKELIEGFCTAKTGGTIWDLEKYAFDHKTTYELINKKYEVLLLEAQNKIVDSYFQYIEKKREPKDRFYMPRRKQLIKIGLVDALQGMIDDKYDILCVSLVPGAGKSTIEKFFHSAVAGWFPKDYSLFYSHSGDITRMYYDTFVVYYSNGRPAFSCQIGEDENGANIYYVFTDNEWFDIRNDKIYASGINGNRAIPVIEYPNNARRLSDIEMTIAITDAINVLTSDRINGVEQFVSAWVKFVNCEIDIDTFRKMRQEGALVVKSNNGSDNKADVDVMTSELNQTEGQVVFTDLFERFLSIQGLANRQGNTGGDTGSAVELRNGHYDAGLRTAINEPILKKSERMALRLILNRLRINKGFTLMPSDVEIHINHNKLDNMGEKFKSVATRYDVIPFFFKICSNLEYD